MRMLFQVFVATTIALNFQTTARAASREGRKIWHDKCLACHELKNIGPTSPSFWAGVQWERFIERKRHKNIEELPSLSDKEKRTLIEYLKSSASDADSPEVAGLR